MNYRALASENERLKLRLARCRCRPSEKEDERVARLRRELDEERRRQQPQPLDPRLAEALGIPDLVRRYRHQLRASQRRIEVLEAALSASAREREADAAQKREETQAAPVSPVFFLECDFFSRS